MSLSSTDPELARLVADVSVARTPAPRRSDGGERGGIGARANQHGTYDHSTVSGQAMTVLSDVCREEGVPTEINMAGEEASVEVVEMFSQQASGAKRFKIFVVPGLDNGFATYCFQFIGQGASFCTSKNCGISHHHASVKTVKPGEVYVAKGLATAFVLPSLGDSVLHPEALKKWKALSLTLPNWNEKFFIATAASDDVPASTEDIEIREEFFRTKALNFKTPAKHRFGTDTQDSPSLELDVQPYSPFFRTDEEAPITEIGHVSGVLAKLDEGVVNNNEALILLTDDYRHEHRKVGDAISSLWLRMEALSSSLGTAPSRLALAYMAPSAWASIGAIADKLDAFGATIGDYGVTFSAYKLEVSAWCQSLVKANHDQYFSRLEEFKTVFIGATRGLSGRLDNVELSLAGLPATQIDREDAFSYTTGRRGETTDRLSRQEAANFQVTHPGRDSIQGVNDKAGDHVERIEARLIALESKLSKLIAKGDERAIHFAGLGFQSIKESNAWLESELVRHPSGLIVDVHMVFEHIHYALEGIDTISTMEKLYKIKVTCIADSVAMTSFDTKTPKFFCKVQGHRVLKGDASYLDLIASHVDWADVATGFRMRLQEALAEFQESHSSFIDQSVEIGSKPHTLAHAALTESSGWIIGFIQFIDEYYRELSKAKFGSGKAWHVTTRLAKRILDDVGTQRYGVQNAFHVGDSRQICQQIVWAVFKSHDTMAEYKRMNFKNHPSISTELVKFLAINTSFEAIERLTAKVAVLEIDSSEAKKQLSAAVKAASSAGNRADEGKKVSDQLSKRVGKLE